MSYDPSARELVIGSAVAILHDGEAPIIASAADHDAIALIDEHKATRICGDRFPESRVGCAVDRFAYPDGCRRLA